MLDCFEVITTSGIVIWSRSYTPVKDSLINSFIRETFIEQNRSLSAGTDDSPAVENASFSKERYTLRWTAVKKLGLIFVAVYQSLLQLSWVDELLDNVRIIFVQLYRDKLEQRQTTDFDYNFDRYFDQQIKELEGASIDGVAHANAINLAKVLDDDSNKQANDALLQAPTSHQTSQASVSSTPSTPYVSRPTTPSTNLLSTNSSKGTSRRARKAASVISSGTSTPASGDERKASTKVGTRQKDASKKMRRWDADGMADEDDGQILDYSSAPTGDDTVPDAVEAIDVQAAGSRTAMGQFILNDLGDEVHNILRDAKTKAPAQTTKTSGIFGSGMSALGGYFRNVVGGKVLERADLDKALKGMEEHLLKKNVAREAAVRLCSGVKEQLLGEKTASFESVDQTIRAALTISLRHLLTPTTSLDILRSIKDRKGKRPYVISIVGVNGVGKSTSLAKLAYFLLQNDFNLLIAACDTFRSGAVEQLRVHARNLQELSSRGSGEAGLGSIELFERGYGRDAAHIAKDAVEYAQAEGKVDVVLIDTAGRRHNDARLMSSLEKFAQLARPDKILMVGEALVGTDSVAQARNFNAAFGADRRLDGFLISKCDTVGDMVGSLVSMVHATGIPVAFLGVGQHYGDLRTLNVDWAVGMLMS